jgi:hypothetical protein
VTEGAGDGNKLPGGVLVIDLGGSERARFTDGNRNRRTAAVLKTPL